jgi:hypothetical protein
MKHLLQLAVLAALPPQAQTPLSNNDFLSKKNLTSFTLDVTTRSLDAYSTNRLLYGPCIGCYKEVNVAWVTGTREGIWLYDEGVSGGIIGLSYLAHRLGHHKIERLIPSIDVSIVAPDVVHNLRLNPRSHDGSK